MGFLSKAHISYIPVKEGRDEFSFLWTNSKRHKNVVSVSVSLCLCLGRKNDQQKLSKPKRSTGNKVAEMNQMQTLLAPHHQQNVLLLPTDGHRLDMVVVLTECTDYVPSLFSKQTATTT